MTTPTSEIEEILAMFTRLEEMCDDDSDQIVATYRRNLRTTLQAQQSKHTAEMERFAREIYEQIKFFSDNNVPTDLFTIEYVLNKKYGIDLTSNL